MYEEGKDQSFREIYALEFVGYPFPKENETMAYCL